MSTKTLIKTLIIVDVIAIIIGAIIGTSIGLYLRNGNPAKDGLCVCNKPQPIKLLQQNLKDAGYYGDEIDGLSGKNTIRLWKLWNKDYVIFSEDGI